MARRAFDVIDVVEVLQHWHAGRSKADVAASVGVDRGTVRKYVAPAEAAGLAPGGPLLSRAEWVELVRGWFPELIDAKARSLTYPEINVHRDRFESMLATNTVTTVHQRLCDEHGLGAGISSFRRYVWLEFGDRPSSDAVTVWRPPVTPGGEAQIDYGYLGFWFEPIVERARRVWAFVMVLACSRHMFVRPVLRMDQRVWVACHVAAFGFFAGVPARLVPENVPRNIFGVLFPIRLCGRRRPRPCDHGGERARSDGLGHITPSRDDRVLPPIHRARGSCPCWRSTSASPRRSTASAARGSHARSRPIWLHWSMTPTAPRPFGGAFRLCSPSANSPGRSDGRRRPACARGGLRH